MASKPKPRGFVEHVISLEGQPDRIAGPVAVVASGLRVDLVLSDRDRQKRRLPRGKGYALGDGPLQPVGPRLAGHLYVLGAHADPRLRKRLPVGHPATIDQADRRRPRADVQERSHEGVLGRVINLLRRSHLLDPSAIHQGQRVGE